jgi:hypothetical protein
MDLQTFATTETTTLLDRLMARQTVRTVEHLHAMRDALDSAARSLEAPVSVEKEVTELVGRLTEAADSQLRRVRDEAQATIDAAHAEIKAHLADIDKLRGTVAQMEAEAAILRSELQTALDRVQTADRDLEATIEAHAALEAALAKAEADTRQVTEARTAAEAQLCDARAAIDLMLVEAEDLRSQIEQRTKERTALETELAETREHGQQQRDAIASDLAAANAKLQVVEQELTRAIEARDERDARVRGLEADLANAHHIRDERDALEGKLDATTARVQALETELAAAAEVRQQRDGVTQALEAATARVHALESELAHAQDAAHQRDAIAGQLDTAQARAHALEGELARAREVAHERDAIAGQLQASAARIQTLEADLSRLRDSGQQRDGAASAQLDAANARLQALEAELVTANEAREQRDMMTTELVASTERIRTLERIQSDQEEQLRQLQALLDEAARKELKALEDAARQARQAAQGDGEDVEVLRAEVERMVSLFDASARAVTEMAMASSSSTLLMELVKRLSLQFSRVALFRLRGNRLEGEHQIGFDDATDMSKLVIPTSIDSILTRAVNSGVVQSMAGADVAVRSGTPFGGTPISAVALPIVLQGTTLAVVYADDSDMPDSARGPAVHESSVGFARLLVGQVVVLLVRHTHELKTLAELSQYATTLLQEAKEMYLADAQAGKATELLRSRLKANIDCASQLYTYRAAMEGTAAAALLDEQIAAEIETGTPFAKDLAAVVHQMSGSDIRLTAEAS